MPQRIFRKAVLAEVIILAVSAALAADLAVQLADHGVGVAAIVAVVCFTLTAGLAMATQVGQGLRTTLYTCPAKDCTVSIRARGANPDELTRLHALATDHSKHGSTR